MLDAHIGGGEPLAPGVGPGGLLQQWQLCDVVGCQLVGGCDQHRAADGDRGLGHQIVRLGTRPVAVAEVDSGVEFGIGKQERPCAVSQVDGNLRMLAQEVTEPWQQPLGAERGDQGQLQRGGALVAHD